MHRQTDVGKLLEPRVLNPCFIHKVQQNQDERTSLRNFHLKLSTLQIKSRSKHKECQCKHRVTDNSGTNIKSSFSTSLYMSLGLEERYQGGRDGRGRQHAWDR
jgi:hypothetical protein